MSCMSLAYIAAIDKRSVQPHGQGAGEHAWDHGGQVQLDKLSLPSRTGLEASESGIELASLLSALVSQTLFSP